MRDHPFDPWDFIVDLKRRWPVVAASCVVALVLALAVSVTLPRRYTATAEILIQAPGGNDPRAATAINPVYLESLKSYERLASSDALFLRALEHVHASEGTTGRSAESLKKSVLRVSKLANTAILEINATMTDPKKAQALAQYVAEQTVEASRAIDSESEGEATRDFRKEVDATSGRVVKARQALEALRGSEPVASLESQMKNNTDLELNVEKDLSERRTDLAGYLAELSSPATVAAPEREGLQRLIASAQARIASLELQRRDLGAAIEQQGRQFQEWTDRREALQADQETARTAFDASKKRLNDMVGTAQLRGERLRMIDPGIVPQEPSSPNVPLNLAASLILSGVGSLMYLVMTFSYQRAKRVRVDARTEAAYSFRS
jgi:succinoglycan biosynthesis transport protein ExoP